MSKLSEIIAKAENTHNFEHSEILALLESGEVDTEIFAAADRVRHIFVGDEVHLRGLIEFSNICKQNCLYCGLRAGNKELHRYRLEPDTIIDFANKGWGYGYKTTVLQGGEDDYYDLDKMVYIIKKIKEIGFAITLSIGQKTFAEYESYRKAGADRYLLRIETTDEHLYNKLSAGRSNIDRADCLKYLKELGFEVGSGIMVGLPEQTLSSIADDILFFKQIDADMLGVGPFIPNPNTPLAEAETGSVDLAFKTMAIIRLLMPDINIPATTAMETSSPNGREVALQRGANVVMPNITEGEYRKQYEIYPGKICVNESPSVCNCCIRGKINKIGRTVSSDYGYRKISGK